MSGTLYDEARCRAACEHIARQIVQPMMTQFRKAPVHAGEKGDRSLVTQADGEIERAIRGYLDTVFPHYGVLGEEFGATRTDREYVWTLDPIDGTEAFVAGVPTFGTLLGLVRQKSSGARVSVLGAVYLPVQDRLIVGNRRETTIDGRVVRVPPAATGQAQRLILGDVAELARREPFDVTALFDLATRFRSAQTWGDCLGYLNLLEGRAHVRVEANLGVDDVAPLEPILLGAGCAVTTGRGETVTAALSGLRELGAPCAFSVVCAADADLHAEVLRVLGMPPPPSGSHAAG